MGCLKTHKKIGKIYKYFFFYGHEKYIFYHLQIFTRQFAVGAARNAGQLLAPDGFGQGFVGPSGKTKDFRNTVLDKNPIVHTVSKSRGGSTNITDRGQTKDK